jgi:hypothetical protein
MESSTRASLKRNPGRHEERERERQSPIKPSVPIMMEACTKLCSSGRFMLNPKSAIFTFVSTCSTSDMDFRRMLCGLRSGVKLVSGKKKKTDKNIIERESVRKREKETIVPL